MSTNRKILTRSAGAVLLPLLLLAAGCADVGSEATASNETAVRYDKALHAKLPAVVRERGEEQDCPKLHNLFPSTWLMRSNLSLR